jgi:hypothetical protein
MYIRRKVFSRFVDSESGEERLFSTTDYTLMSEAEQREFSKKDDDDDDEGEYLREDKKAIKYYKKHPKISKLKEQALKGDPEAKEKLGKRGARAITAIEGGLGAASGAMLGAEMGGGKGALKGAAIGGALGAGAGALTGREIKRNWKNVDKKSRNAQAEIDRELEKDRRAVANGNMTKKEFINKWGGK